MYFPYLRGKQFELIALRELCTLPLNNEKVCPIIEPIKGSTSTLTSTLKSLNQLNVDVNLIVNPSFGDFQKKTQILCDYIISLTSLGIKNVIPTFFISKESDVDLVKEVVSTYHFNDSGFSIIHISKTGKTEELASFFNQNAGRYNIITLGQIMSLRRSFPKSSLVYLTDSFVKKTKNSDYSKNIDESFSNDYKYYKEEGFIGYGDYLTIGSEFADGGFLPYAIAIHLTYENSENDEIRIRHFVSDSNEDTSDVPGKLQEALDKLVPFINAKGMHTIACNQFRDYHKRGAFPGLGVLKKLSIMHHLELVQKIIE